MACLMGWPQQRLYKMYPSQNRGIGPLRCQDDLGQSTGGAWVLASGTQILCKLLAYVRLSVMQGETIIVTLPTKCQPYLSQLPSVKFK